MHSLAAQSSGVLIEELRRLDGTYGSQSLQTSKEPVPSSAGSEQQQAFEMGAQNASLTANHGYGYFRHSITVSVILTIAYSMVFIVGIIGNSVVVAIVCKSPRMRTVTNYFIANLAFADILVLLFCLPATLVGNLFVPYVLGLFVCKTVSYLQGVAVSASINTMVAVTIDRFLAICFPMDWHMSRRMARWTIASIWIFSLSISLPWALYFTLIPYSMDNLPEHTINVCAESWPSERWGTIYFVCANLILLYLLPAVVIILCYIGIWYKIERRSIPGDRPKGLKIELIMQKSKLKVVKMMMVVVILFLLSWLPLYLIFARIKLTEERSQWEDWLIGKVMPLAQWLGASNSCINPILYTFFNRKYKHGFAGLLRYGICCKLSPAGSLDSSNVQHSYATQMASHTQMHSMAGASHSHSLTQGGGQVNSTGTTSAATTVFASTPIKVANGELATKRRSDSTGVSPACHSDAPGKPAKSASQCHSKVDESDAKSDRVASASPSARAPSDSPGAGRTKLNRKRKRTPGGGGPKQQRVLGSRAPRSLHNSATSISTPSSSSPASPLSQRSQSASQCALQVTSSTSSNQT